MQIDPRCTYTKYNHNIIVQSIESKHDIAIVCYSWIFKHDMCTSTIDKINSIYLEHLTWLRYGYSIVIASWLFLFQKQVAYKYPFREWGQINI